MDGYLLWEAPQGTLSILVRRSVLQRLKLFAEHAFSDAFGNTGATLIGRSEDLIESGRRVITIENFDTGVSGLHGGTVVGFVRFRRQQTLHLNETDFLVLRSGLGLVCLLVRPDGNGGAIGGFFYRDGTTVQCPSAGMQFPIDGGPADCRVAPVSRPVPAAVIRVARAKRVVYATVGLALMLSPVAIWLLNR